MKARSIIGGVVTAALFIVGLSLLPANGRVNNPAAAFSGAGASFDHSNCQYPDRWSNPVDGCDNSDPAVPECTKGWATQEAEQTCIAEFVRQHEVQGGEQVNNPPQVSTPSSNQCGGSK